MKKLFVLVIISLIVINAGFCADDSVTEIKQVDIPLIEPVKIIEIEQVKAPVSFLTEEQLKDLEEKAALPSIEDIQEKSENTLDEVREEQSAITDTISDENSNDDNIIELNINNKKTLYNNNKSNNHPLPTKNTSSKNVNNNKKDLSLNWDSKKYDQLNINFGAGQVQYDDNGQTRIQTNNGTIYRW